MEVEKVKIDLIMIGNPNSGKTSLIRQFIDGENTFSHFYNPTLGINLEKKVVFVDDKEVTVCIWDTAGQERFYCLTKSYFNRADGVLIIYDITNRQSFERIQKFWLPEIKEKSGEGCVELLIGNKMDLAHERAVAECVVNDLCERMAIKYLQTSAKTGQNVDKAILLLVKMCLNKVKDDEKRGIDIDSARENSKKRNRCFAFFQNIFNKAKQ